jgi:hypothetical protein
VPKNFWLVGGDAQFCGGGQNIVGNGGRWCQFLRRGTICCYATYTPTYLDTLMTPLVTFLLAVFVLIGTGTYQLLSGLLVATAPVAHPVMTGILIGAGVICCLVLLVIIGYLLLHPVAR